MRWHWGSKDGGAESKVYMYGLEIKSLFSVLVLRFEDGSREAYHSHAFNAVSWVLQGYLREMLFGQPGEEDGWYEASLRPIWTPRERFHKVSSFGRTWVLTFRGPWAQSWQDYDEKTGTVQMLTHGRIAVA